MPRRVCAGRRIAPPRAPQLKDFGHGKSHSSRTREKSYSVLFRGCVRPTRIPVRVVRRVNRNTAAASRNNRGGGNIMLLKLLKMNDVPPSGKQLGTFVNVESVSGKDEDGHEFNHLVVRVELDATDKVGKK